jgi:PTH1 family peptidyl-tRNA hydrolase
MWLASGGGVCAEVPPRDRQHEKNAMTGTGRVAGGSVMVAKPLTYMNLSGEAVRLLVNAYLESPAEMIVVYDDIDLPLGKLRIRPNGSSGTHNGMRSIVAELATENFPRLRVGIGASDQGRLATMFSMSSLPTMKPIGRGPSSGPWTRCSCSCVAI